MLPKDLAEILVKADPNSTVGFTGKYLYIKANINLDALAEALEEYVRPPSSLQEFQRLDELMGELSAENYNFYDGDRIPDGVLESLDAVAQKLLGFRLVRPDKKSDTDVGVNVKGPEMGGRPDWVKSEPETGIKDRHVCTPDCPPITEHVHHAGCAFGSPDCPEFGRKRSKPDGFFTRMRKVLNRS